MESLEKNPKELYRSVQLAHQVHDRNARKWFQIVGTSQSKRVAVLLKVAQLEDLQLRSACDWLIHMIPAWEN